ncbi:Hypothetical predicted protein [Octopus vulgaris]|uniref:Uncharacterized protein n=1 Tax=Octopus vulgaris TaxID=6645 RepID=A0AA36B234_OCTVU|nr:Hypothetical predicted protein [Octopus vulgaris]
MPQIRRLTEDRRRSKEVAKPGYNVIHECSNDEMFKPFRLLSFREFDGRDRNKALIQFQSHNLMAPPEMTGSSHSTAIQ